MNYPLTRQDCFDRVWQAFVVEKKPCSIDCGGFCRYRGHNGKKCAMGLLIPDEVYDPVMEGHNPATIIDRHASVRSLFAPDVTGLFLDHLQLCYDDAARCGRKAFHKIIFQELNDFATGHLLVIPANG